MSTLHCAKTQQTSQRPEASYRWHGSTSHHGKQSRGKGKVPFCGREDNSRRGSTSMCFPFTEGHDGASSKAQLVVGTGMASSSAGRKAKE